MRLLYCAHPLDARQPDPDYAGEAATAAAHGLGCDLISYEALVNDRDASRAVRRVTAHDDPTTPELAIYRGWMLRPTEYAQLYAALLARGLRLINGPAQYRHAHYLPESYPLIAAYTPPTVWLPLAPQTAADALPMAQIMAALRPFGDAPVIVKDYVKSRKHEWAAATYIPSAADPTAVARVVGRFVAGQGPDLNEGLVFRAFERYTSLGTPSRGGQGAMPQTQEHRIFWLDGAPLATAPHWEAAEPGDVSPIGSPPIMQLQPIAQRIQSRFFTMDVAPLAAAQPHGAAPDVIGDQIGDGTDAEHGIGAWRIVELGDAQVAGLPARVGVAAFYAALIAALAPGATTTG